MLFLWQPFINILPFFILNSFAMYCPYQLFLQNKNHIFYHNLLISNLNFIDFLFYFYLYSIQFICKKLIHQLKHYFKHHIKYFVIKVLQKISKFSYFYVGIYPKPFIKLHFMIFLFYFQIRMIFEIFVSSEYFLMSLLAKRIFIQIYYYRFNFNSILYFSLPYFNLINL